MFATADDPPGLAATREAELACARDWAAAWATDWAADKAAGAAAGEAAARGSGDL